MRFTTKTEYGFVCMAYLAGLYAQRRWAPTKEIAAQGHYPPAFTEKILQALRQAKLVVSRHGNRGGYALARAPHEITLRDVIVALEGATFEVFCQPEVRQSIICAHFCLCGIKPVWRKTKELLDHYYGSITLDMLTKNEIEIQRVLPAA